MPKPGVLPALVRLLAGPRPDVQGDQFETCALAHHPLRRQAAGAAERHLASPEVDPVQARVARQGQAAEAVPTRDATIIKPAPARDESFHSGTEPSPRHPTAWPLA